MDSPALAFFNPNLPTVVWTDASGYGLGGILAQIHPDITDRLVAFASGTLTLRNANTRQKEKKEALGCVCAAGKVEDLPVGIKVYTLHS